MSSRIVRTLGICLLVLAPLCVPGTTFAAGKIDICHFADDHPGRVIRVASQALDAHKSHRDCTDYTLDEAGACSCPLQDLLAAATFAARLDFPASTSWNLEAIKTDPAYASGTIEGSYLVVRGRQFSDYPATPEACCDPQPIPAGIGLQFAFGNDGTIWVFTNAPLPQAFMPLFGFPSSINHRPTMLWVPTGFNLSLAELQLLWDQGIRVQIDWNDKFFTLAQLGMKLYADVRDRGLVTGPLSNMEVVRDTRVSILNQAGGRVAIGLARIAADCIGNGFHGSDLTARWWPKGVGNACGSAEWGFSVMASDSSAPWLACGVAYGDNGTTQTILWDGQVYAQHVNYGSMERYSTSPGSLPGTIAMSHQNNWSGNANDFVLMMRVDALEFSGVWESPATGDLPAPIVRYLENGWN